MKKLLVPALLVSLLAACGTTPSTDGAPVEGRDASASAYGAGALGANGLPVVLSDPKSPLSKRSVYFDLDRFEIKMEYQDLVAAHAKFLAANPGMRVLVQGNTDERGSREYNLSLGQKRSDAVKRSLVLMGATEAQVESVSLGEEKPRAEGSNEAAWTENRRADILYRAADGRGEF